jgi:hypothetical protein
MGFGVLRALLRPAAKDGGSLHAAVGREVPGDGVGDGLVGHVVEAGGDEGGQLRVGVELGGEAGAVRPAMRGGGGRDRRFGGRSNGLWRGA